MVTRFEKRRQLEKSADSFVKSLTEARDTIDEAIDDFEKGDYESGLGNYAEAERKLERTSRRAQRVSDAFDDAAPSRR